MEFKTFYIEELLKIKNGKDHKALNDGNYPVYGSGGLMRYADKYLYDKVSILLPRKGTLDNIQYVNEPFWTVDTIYYTEVNERLVNPYYLFRYLRAMDLSGYDSGASIPSMTTKTYNRIKVKLPPLVIQNRITDVIRNYDELIEVNNQRIKKLEQTAEELYKEWFVRFRFPNYQNTEFENGIPKGWIKTKLKEISLECGKQEKKENREKYNYYVPIDCLNSKSMSVGSFESIDNAESSLLSFRKNDILFGAMRPYFHKVTMMPFGGLTRSTCFVISPINESYRYYLYLTLFQKSSVDFATTVSVGSTMPYVRWNDFSRLSVIKPDINTVEMFNTQVIPIISEIHSLYFSNQTLIKQRDLLLPRLMSGKLEV